MPIKAVIFDLDGTITQPFLDFDAIRTEMGLGEESGTILEEMEKMTPQQKQRAEGILRIHEQQAVQQSRLNDGARETLDALRAKGIKIGILTRNKRANALAVADKHGLTFDVVVDREDGPVKPDAFGVLRLCESFGARPQESLVVGDYLYDLLCAKAAGAVAVLLKNRRTTKNFARYADFTINTLDEVLEIINYKSDNCERLPK